MAYTRLRTIYYSNVINLPQFTIFLDDVTPLESYHLYTLRFSLIGDLPTGCIYDFERELIKDPPVVKFLLDGYCRGYEEISSTRYETAPIAPGDNISDIHYAYPDRLGTDSHSRVSKTGRTNHQIVGSTGLCVKLATALPGQYVDGSAPRLVIKGSGYMNTGGYCANVITIFSPQQWVDKFVVDVLGWV